MLHVISLLFELVMDSIILLRVRFTNHREARSEEVLFLFSFFYLNNFLIFLSFACNCKTLIKRKLFIFLLVRTYFSEFVLSIITKLTVGEV